MLKKQWVRILLVIGAIVALLTAVFFGTLIGISVRQNRTIHVTEYTVTAEELPDSFKGKRIVQLSDLHNRDYGEQLTSLVKAQNPDIIVITGDWIGYIDTDITVAKKQLSALVGIAPMYYVAGNHEARSPLYDELYDHLLLCGVNVMHAGGLLWTVGEESVQLLGMDDPEFSAHLWRDMAPYVRQDLYSILLFHRPEYIEEIATYGVDLVLSGHTHGGQIRLPLVGAVYAPDQRWFPTYDRGRFEVGDTTLIISQGLGESAYMRILTPPEIVVVTLD